MTNDSGSYHQDCYRNYILPKCDACGHPLDGQYSIDSWGNKFHTRHESETGICSSCSKIVSEQTTNSGFIHNDGRIICSLCNKDAISTEKEIEDSRRRVLNQLADVGFFNLDNNVPIKVVNRNQLSKLRGGDPNIRGLTDYKYSSTTNSRGEVIEEHKEYTIYVLDKLPELVFDSVLAHEYLHVWLFENDQNYKSNITEGFCNLGAYAIYNGIDDKFSKIQLGVMDKNPDPDYGEGYRKIKKCLEKQGWSKLIKNVKNGKASLCY